MVGDAPARWSGGPCRVGVQRMHLCGVVRDNNGMKEAQGQCMVYKNADKNRRINKHRHGSNKMELWQHISSLMHRHG